MSIKIVHFSSTPLVGAPAKIAAAQRMIGCDSISVYEHDYPSSGGLAGKFVDDCFQYGANDPILLEVLREKIRESQIIHIHNTISNEAIEFIKKNSFAAKFIYHVHSPLREGPLYLNRSDYFGLPFERFLAVAQYQPRHYPDFIPVPNIVIASASLNERKNKSLLRVMYTPTHKRGGRWNSKYSEALENAVDSLRKNKKIEVITPAKPIHPELLMEIRRSCHISIDEIATGAYHQVSLEGLCAGNIVINKADYFSKMMLARFAEGVFPPFVYADYDNIFDVLNDFSNDEEKVRLIQKNSYEYFDKYLTPTKLINSYINIYHDVL